MKIQCKKLREIELKEKRTLMYCTVQYSTVVNLCFYQHRVWCKKGPIHSPVHCHPMYLPRSQLESTNQKMQIMLTTLPIKKY